MTSARNVGDSALISGAVRFVPLELILDANSQHGQRSQPTFVAWLTQNPTGIPVRQALWRVAFGILLGLVIA